MSQLWQTFLENWSNLLTALYQHIYLSLIAIIAACLVSIPLGIYLARHKKQAGPVIAIVAIIQTIPSLALLGFMIPIFGIGTLPALIALGLYALLPILRNTYTGITQVDRPMLEAGEGMGMTKWQILWHVELPMARNVILAGVRTAMVWTIGTATLATFIGAGGLGDIIMRGIDMINTPMILVGAIPAAILALVFDGLLILLDKALTPKGLRKSVKKESAKDREAITGGSIVEA